MDLKAPIQESNAQAQEGERAEAYAKYAQEFHALAARYLQVAAYLESVEAHCTQAGIPRDQAQDILFTHAVPQIKGGADCIDQVVKRLMEAAGSAALKLASHDVSQVSFRPTNTMEDTRPQVCIALDRAAVTLNNAMTRALDLADEVGNPQLVGDTHPFGHLLQGICIPYLMLAADNLSQN